MRLSRMRQIIGSTFEFVAVKRIERLRGFVLQYWQVFVDQGRDVCRNSRKVLRTPPLSATLQGAPEAHIRRIRQAYPGCQLQSRFNFLNRYMMQSTMVPNEMKGIFRATLLWTVIIFTHSGCISRSSESEIGDPAVERAAIEALLMRQQDAWNEGDIDAFMSDYVQSDTLRFTSGGTVRYGWDSAMERYLTTYPDRDAMGELTFSDLAIDILSAEWALAFGAWHLKRDGDYSDIGGRYTLLMHRGPDGWKVLYDHTSQADS